MQIGWFVEKSYYYERFCCFEGAHGRPDDERTSEREKISTEDRESDEHFNLSFFSAASSTVSSHNFV